MISALEEIVTELREADRQERIDLLIDFAKSLPALPVELEPLRDDAHRVPECQSPVFLFVSSEGGRLVIHADAPIEAPTVRGFISILVEGLSGAPLAEARDLPLDLIDRAGITELLGMQRRSGLAAVLRRLRNQIVRVADQSEALSPRATTEESKAMAKANDDQILEALRTVKDPELGVNVVDLGLVYTFQSRESEVDIEMTLTSPACPAGPQIVRDATTALERIEGVTKANVRLVLSPPWTPDRMTDDARDQLGIF